MLINNYLTPAVYKLNREKDGNHYLTYLYPKFTVPKKRYGTLDADVELVWNDYRRSLSGTGVMLTGGTGTGKSLLGEVLANKAIDNGMIVIYCTEIRTDITTINYLAMMRNSVIFMDEFGKNFSNELQNKMLSMLASVSGGKKLFIITESIIGRINSDILNRTKRIKYHFEYDRVDKDVLIEYCNDKGVSNEFFKELYEKYETSPIFSFDNLEGIVDEHLARPNVSLDELLRVLNLSALVRPLYVNIRSIKCIKSGKDVNFKFDNKSIKLKDFMDGRRIWVDIFLSEENISNIQNEFDIRNSFTKNIMLSSEMITRVDGNLYTLVYSNEYEIYLEGK